MPIELTVCFIERTWAGYGVGVQISGISIADSARWGSFYRAGAADYAAQRQPIVPACRTGLNQHIVIVDDALSAVVANALRSEGFRVSHVPSVNEAIQVLHNEPVDVVISDLHRPGLDGLALCCHVTGNKLPTRTVILTTSSVPREFLLGLYAGATRVIAKPCSNEVLVTRIREVLQQPLPTDQAQRPNSSASPAPAEAASARSGPGPVTTPGPLRLSPKHAADRASHYLGQVYRYVSERLVRRQVA